MKRQESAGPTAGAGYHAHSNNNNNQTGGAKKARFNEDEDGPSFEDLADMGDDEIAYETIGDIEPDGGLDVVSESRWRRKIPAFNPGCQDLCK
jgi:hypothetical protein